VAIGRPRDGLARVKAARAISELTHYGPDVRDALMLWCCAIRHAILTGVLDAPIGLHHIDADRRGLCDSWLDVAEGSQPYTSRTTGALPKLQPLRRCRRGEPVDWIHW
jgi:ADP-ribosyl-[dinitrogen reductase] hydrolase